MNSGLSGHIGNIWRMIDRANCEDRFLSNACTKSISLEDLSREIMGEMENRRPPIDINRKREGRAIAIVRTVYQIPIEAIDGLTSFEVQDIEAGRIFARASNLCCYSEAIGIRLNEFLDKVSAVVDVLKVFEAIA